MVTTGVAEDHQGAELTTGVTMGHNEGHNGGYDGNRARLRNGSVLLWIQEKAENH